jgi:hypothetical protein
MSVAFAIIGLALGISVFALFQSMVYPALRRAHETAKVTQSQGVDPSVYRIILQAAGLVLLPIAGFILGHQLSSQ